MCLRLVVHVSSYWRFEMVCVFYVYRLLIHVLSPHRFSASTKSGIERRLNGEISNIENSLQNPDPESIAAAVNRFPHYTTIHQTSSVF